LTEVGQKPRTFQIHSKALHKYYVDQSKITAKNNVTVSFYCHQALQNIALSATETNITVIFGSESIRKMPIKLTKLPEADECWSLPTPNVTVTPGNGTITPIKASLLNYDLTIEGLDNQKSIGPHTIKIETKDLRLQNKTAQLEILVEIVKPTPSCDPLDLTITEDSQEAAAIPKSVELTVGQAAVEFTLPSFIIDSKKGVADVNTMCAPVLYNAEVTGSGVTSFAKFAMKSNKPTLTLDAKSIDQVGQY